MKTRKEHGDVTYTEILSILHQDNSLNTFEKFIETGASWHLQCYKTVTHSANIASLKVRYQRLKNSTDLPTLTKVGPGRPLKELKKSTTPTHSETPLRAKRTLNFDKNLCVFCQSQQISQPALHEASSRNVTNDFRKIAELTSEDSIRSRLSILLGSDDDLAARTYDMKYHLKCKVKHQRLAEASSAAKSPKEEESHFQIICDLEIIDFVNRSLSDGEILSMNEVKTTYDDILEKYSFKPKISNMSKRYLKELIKENVDDISFNRPMDVTKPEQILSTTKSRECLSSSSKKKDKTFWKILLDASKILRKEILDSPVWKFTGSFDNYDEPELLNWFVGLLLHGNKPVKNAEKRKKIKHSNSIVSQHIVQAVKTDKQITHDSENIRMTRETPIGIGLQLAIYQECRSKHLITLMNNLGFGITHDKVLDTLDSISNHVKKKVEERGHYLPLSMVNDTFTWFALDNIDFLEDTPSGKNTLHGTAMAMFQNMTERTSDEEMVLIRPADKNDKLRKIDATVKPFNYKIENPKCKISIELNSLNDEGKNLKDFTWVLGSLNLSQSEKKVDGCGTWGAFNSLISSKLPPKTNVAVIPPILRLPPSNDSVLYTALLKIHDVSKQVNISTTKTVVTLDLQLYDIAMKFYCSSLEIRNLFLFRPGELHIVIWALACIGDYIEGSGLDQAWVEAGLYSATTVNNQILKGKHIYRSLECHFITILSIYTLYFDHILKDLPDEHRIVTDLSNAIRDAFEKDATDQSDSRDALSKILEDSYFYDKIVGISEKLKIHQESMKPIQRFLLNYVHQFENLLLFIRATRDRDIDLHLRATENLIKYFFAHDHLNYARLLPLYLATMQDVKKNEPSLWQEFKLGNFCVSKTNIRFTSIGPDHGIEHENRRMKVAGGIVGITQNENALDRFFITAPHLSSLVCKFERKYGLDNRKNIDRHHDLINTKAKRIKENVDKLCNVIKEHGDPFDSTENGLFNLLTQAFVTKKMENDILKRDDLGLKAFQNFVLRLDGHESIWSRLSKMKLSTFKNCNKMMKLTTEQGKVVALKEERNLLQRFIIIARSRPELSLEECIGEYEFGVVPRSLFSADGSLLPSRDKHKVSNLITKAIGDSTEDAHMINTVIILDGMAVVNALPTELIKMAKTCSDLANVFINRLALICNGYTEVRLVFDRYQKESLKSRTREYRRRGLVSTRYRITDNTIIKDVKLKELLADVDTKSDLTTYLAEKVLNSNRFKRIIVTHQTITTGNFQLPDLLVSHDHEEADTLIILHSSTLSKDNYLYVYAKDADIFFQLINRYPSLPPNTFLINNTSKVSIKHAYEYLGKPVSMALMGWHAMSGNDICGKISGLSKEASFKRLLELDNEILVALTSLGKDETLPNDSVIKTLEKYVSILYGCQKISKLNDLRWHFYSRKQKQGENLPPTSAAFRQHVYRAHYTAMVWYRNTVNYQNLPPPDGYGWKKEDELYVPVMTMNSPAPKAVINLVRCNCKKGCEKKCSCKQNGLGCTEICGCIDFECRNFYNVDLDEKTFDEHTDETIENI